MNVELQDSFLMKYPKLPTPLNQLPAAGTKNGASQTRWMPVCGCNASTLLTHQMEQISILTGMENQ